MPTRTAHKEPSKTTRRCLELSLAEVDQLVITELRKRYPGALPISIDYEPRTEVGFCHAWYVAAEDGAEVHRKFAPGLREVLHGAPLTEEEKDAHEESGESFHVPAIVHRTASYSAKELNTCGICGAQIIPGSIENSWVKASCSEADAIRNRRK